MEKYGVSKLTADEIVDISGGIAIVDAIGYGFGQGLDLAGMAITYVINSIIETIHTGLSEFLMGLRAN